MEIKVKVRKASDSRGQTLGYADVELIIPSSGTLKLYGFTVQKNKTSGNAPWIGFPEKQNAQGQWWRIVSGDRPMSILIAKEILKAFSEVAK